MALADGTRMSLRRPDAAARRRRVPPVHGRHDRRLKGATLLHRNVVANILQTEAWFKPMLDKLGDKPAHRRVRAAAVSHLRADDLLHDGRAPGHDESADPEPARHSRASSSTLRGYQVNMFPAVNTLFNALANEPDFARLDFSELVVSNGGGMAVQQATAREVAEDHRLPGRRGLRAVRDVAGRDQQSARPARVQRHHRPADPVDRHRHSRRRWATTSSWASRARSASAARR